MIGGEEEDLWWRDVTGQPRAMTKTARSQGSAGYVDDRVY